MAPTRRNTKPRARASRSLRHGVIGCTPCRTRLASTHTRCAASALRNQDALGQQLFDRFEPHIEMANGLVMLHGRTRVAKAGKLYARAAALEPRDAMERLDVETAKGDLE